MEYFHSFDYHEEDDLINNWHYNHIYCFNEKSEACMIKVKYPPYCMIKPSEIMGGWNKVRLDELYDILQKSDRSSWKACIDPDEIVGDVESYKCRAIRGYLDGKKRYLKLRFRTKKAMSAAKGRFERKKVHIDGQCVTFQVCESDIESVRQFTIDRQLPYCGWFAVNHSDLLNGEVTEEEKKISYFKHEYHVDWESVGPLPGNRKGEISKWRVYPRIGGYDIECKARTPLMFPSPFNPSDISFAISLVYQVHGKPDTMQTYCVIYGDAYLHESAQKKGIKVISTNSEDEMMTEFCRLVRDLEIDIMVGHNNLEFDDSYLTQRWQNIWKNWPELGSRIKGQRPEFHDHSWSSKNTNAIAVRYVSFPGRITFDTRKVAQANLLEPLPSYSLKFVSEHYLGDKKEDLDHTDIFHICDNYIKVYNRLSQCTKEVSPDGQPSPHDNIDREAWKFILEEYNEALKQMGTLITYCCKDSELALRIFEKLNVWINVSQAANIVQVRAKYVYIKGQQYKSLSQVYGLLKESTKEDPHGVVLNIAEIEDNDKKYEGAINWGTEKGFIGYQKHVGSIDVVSMYPSIVSANNLCLSTELTSDQRDDYEKEEYREHTWTEQKTGDHYDLAFVTPKIHHGFFPRLVDNLMSQRKAKKKEMGEVAKDPNRGEGSFDYLVLNAVQNALKVSANSVYGILGMGSGAKLPAKHIAALVTKIGRDTARKMAAFLEHGGDPKEPPQFPPSRIIYGDSVVGDTPILIKRKGIIQYVRIEDIPRQGHWYKFKDEDEKEYATPEEELEVWSDKGFTPIKSIMRHYTKKNIYRVVTNSGVVDVTEDHSLLDFRGQKISPKDVKDDTILLHAELPTLDLGKSTTAPQWRDYSYKDKLEAAIAFCNFRQLGYEILVGCRPSADGISGDCSLRLFKSGALMPGKDPWELHGLDNLGPCNDYVYDLETENHHFAAGVGKLIVHNTDSLQFIIEDPNLTVPQRIEMSKDITNAINKHIAPLAVELEKWGDIFVVSPKKYIFHFRDVAIIKDSKPNPGYAQYIGNDKKAYKYTGVEFVKRNQPEVLKRLYRRVVDGVMCEKLEKLGIKSVTDSIDEEMQRVQYIVDSVFKELYLLIYNKNELKDYIVYESYNGEDKKLGPLGINMAALGKPIQVGERVGYVVVDIAKIKGTKMKKAEKYRLIDAIAPTERIDVKHYLDQMTTPIDNALAARYGGADDIYQQWFEKKQVRQRMMQVLLEGGFITLQECSGKPDQDISKRIFSDLKEKKAVPVEFDQVGSYRELLKYRESDDYKSKVDKSIKTSLTRFMKKETSKGVALTLPIPELISNISTALQLGAKILDKYAEIMMSSAGYHELVTMASFKGK